MGASVFAEFAVDLDLLRGELEQHGLVSATIGSCDEDTFSF
jgi:hypothetical protein